MKQEVIECAERITKVIGNESPIVAMNALKIVMDATYMLSTGKHPKKRNMRETMALEKAAMREKGGK